MFKRSKINGLLSTFLLMAFVHQLNACTCGSLEHNGWYQLGKSWIADAAVFDGILSPSPHSNDNIQSDDCDGELILVYLPAGRLNVDFEGKVNATVGATPCHVRSDVYAGQIGNVAHGAALMEHHAAGVCAWLQVFLI